MQKQSSMETFGHKIISQNRHSKWKVVEAGNQIPLESGPLIHTVIQINNELGSSVKKTDFLLFSRILKLKGFFFSIQTMPCHCHSFCLSRISIENKKTHLLFILLLFFPNLCQYILKIEKLKEKLFLKQALLHKFICPVFPRQPIVFCILLILMYVSTMKMTKMRQYIATDTSKLNREAQSKKLKTQNNRVLGNGK